MGVPHWWGVLLHMNHPHEPIDAITSWQEWYKNNRVVACLDEPLITKGSRENMHDTTNALLNYIDTVSFEKAKQHFADTLAEFANELSGKDLYKAFYSAAVENMDAVEKEYKEAKAIVDMLRNGHAAL